MLPVSLISSKLALAAGAAIAAVLLAWGSWQWWQRNAAERELLEYQASAAQVIGERLQDNARIERETAAKLKETTDAYQTRVADLRARYDRLRLAPGGSGHPMPPANPGQPGALDAAADTAGRDLPRCVQSDRREELSGILEAADTCLLRLASCQAWVREQERPP
jgi:hypothetical protein